VRECLKFEHWIFMCLWPANGFRENRGVSLLSPRRRRHLSEATRTPLESPFCETTEMRFKYYPCGYIYDG